MHTHKMYSLHIKSSEEVPLMTESRVGPPAAGGPSCQAPWITHSPPCLQRAAQKLAGASAVSKRALATFCPAVAWRPIRRALGPVHLCLRAWSRLEPPT